jgi:trans-2,3-dihydro-3-hydroxyanthranilate isomerase
MRRYAFATVDVFTDRRFGGNQLAVFPDARGLSGDEMQSIAAEFNLSETTFVLPPDDPAHTARVRIFNRTAEMPFAGHPNVGTAFVLAASGHANGERIVFEELAGLVDVAVHRDEHSAPTGATITAPQPLAMGETMPAATLAACVGLDIEDVVLRSHPPRWASMGNPFVLAEVTNEALTRAVPDVAAYRDAAPRHARDGRLSIHLYARNDGHVRARMFAPLSRTFEDAATGSANAPLGGLLLSLTTENTLSVDVVQGVEMGRPSRLHVTARRTSEGITATVGGSCVPVMQGELLV